MKEESVLEAIAPEAITADKANLSFLLLQQMDRINFLLTSAIAGTNEHRTKAHISLGVLMGLRSVESMIYPKLSEKYKEDSVEIKKQLFQPNRLKIKESLQGAEEKEALKDLASQVFLCQRAPIPTLIFCAQWYDLLVSELSNLGLMPTRQKVFDFGEGSFDRSAARTH